MTERFLERWLNHTAKHSTSPATWLRQKATERGFASSIFNTVTPGWVATALPLIILPESKQPSECRAILFYRQLLRCLRRRSSAQLLHKPRHVSLVPAFYDCTASYTVNRDSCKRNRITSCWNTHEGSGVRSSECPSPGDLVPFGDQVVNCRRGIREGSAKHGYQLFEALSAGRRTRERSAINKVSSKYLIQRGHISIVPQLFIKAMNESFVLFLRVGHSECSPFVFKDLPSL